MAEQTSWTKPGSVSSALRVPPPTVSAASTTSTERPASASVTAADSPFGPAPTTTASYEARLTELIVRVARPDPFTSSLRSKSRTNRARWPRTVTKARFVRER